MKQDVSNETTWSTRITLHHTAHEVYIPSRLVLYASHGLLGLIPRNDMVHKVHGACTVGVA